MSALVRLRPAPDEVEDALAALWSLGPGAVEERDGELLAGFGDEVAARVAAAALAARWAVSVEPTPDPADWRDRWRAFAAPVVVGRVTVVPAWLDGSDPHVPTAAGSAAERRAGDVVVRLDPGEAFGSGSHPTTRLALAALPRAVRPGASVLDLGSGSGVLAVAAAVLGAGRAVAVDIDPEARRATAENAARNGVTVEVIDLADVQAAPGGDDAAAGPPFDVVVANIGAGALVDLASTVAPLGRRLLLTGILAGAADRVRAAYPDHYGEAVDEEDGWVLLDLTTVRRHGNPGPA